MYSCKACINYLDDKCKKGLNVEDGRKGFCRQIELTEEIKNKERLIATANIHRHIRL